MNARQSPTPAPGPDLLARYLNAYLQARQMSDVERPWGLGDDGLDALWGRLSEAMSDPQRLDKLVAEELNDTERNRIVETLAPLIFALPLRSYPAELRAIKSGPRLILSLRHLPPANGNGNGNGNGKHDHHPDPEEALEAPPSPAKDSPALAKDSKGTTRKAKEKDKESIDSVGFLPAALTEPFAAYLRRVLKWDHDRQRCVVTISSGGRRRRVRVTILAHVRGVVVRFLERVHSPAEDGA